MDEETSGAAANASLTFMQRTAGRLTAAALLALVGVILAVVLLLRPPAPTVVATADLAATDDRAATRTTATVVEVNERRELHLPLDLPTPDEGHYEVWLLSPDIAEIVSLGPVREDGRYPIPAEVAIAAVPVVDVSAEPDDGDPGHSGQSVLRGTLLQET
ncbi:hypothetical protein BH23ACT9_BH23ACT9_32650 [soil metagenome]